MSLAEAGAWSAASGSAEDRRLLPDVGVESRFRLRLHGTSPQSVRGISAVGTTGRSPSAPSSAEPPATVRSEDSIGSTTRRVATNELALGALDTMNPANYVVGEGELTGFTDSDAATAVGEVSAAAAVRSAL